MNYFEKKDLWNEAQGAYLEKHPEDVDAIRTLSEDYTFIQNDCVFLCKAPEVVAKFNLKTKQFEELSELEELIALTRHNLLVNPGHGPVNVKVIDESEEEEKALKAYYERAKKQGLIAMQHSCAEVKGEKVIISNNSGTLAIYNFVTGEFE